MLALLGLTAAIGLTMVALALNQGWPLIAGAPIPGFESEHQAVGDATVAATARARGVRPAISAVTGRTSPAISSGKPGHRHGGIAALGRSRPPRATGLVVAHPTPASPAGSGPPSNSVPDPTTVVQQSAPETAPAPTSAVAAVPASNANSSSSGPVAESAPESPIPSRVPPAADEGNGHDHGHHSSGGPSHGHGHGHSTGRDDSGPPESNEDPETAPAPGEAPVPEAAAPDESNGGQVHGPSWGHGGGHDRGHW